VSRVYTASRSWGSSTSAHGVRWMPCDAPNGRYEVWYRDSLIAETTDRYMADAVWGAVTARATPHKGDPNG
jgi:hypothetical protein